jgi:hypothetical protein
MLCIHFILIIFRRLYDYRKLMTSIMNRFFCVVSSLIKQSYNNFGLMANTKKNETIENVEQRRFENYFEIKIMNECI